MVAMKNALLKDTFREIRRSLSRFLSIFAIVALGVAFFAGVKASARDMEITGDKYFDDYNLMDIRIVSTLGFDNKDISAIKKTQDLEGIWTTYSIDAIAELTDRDMVIKVLGLPMDKINNPDESYINRTKLIAGRYPESPNECVAEEGKILNPELSIGSKVSISSGTEKDISESLVRKEYTIVGLVETPYYISYERGSSSIGNGKVNSFIMVPEENFKLEVYTDVFATVKGAREVFTFDEEYDDIVNPVIDSLKETAKIREQERYNEIMLEAGDKLEESKKELADAEEKSRVELEKALDKPSWYVLDRNKNPGYADYAYSADRVAAIAKVFPVFFFLIAALVCLTTMTRMVDEQRIYIGTLKALGYSKFSVASKYLLYAAMASISGSIFGFLAGFKLFPTIILNAYSIMFTMPPAITAFSTYYAVSSTAIVVSITVLAAWFASSSELKEVPSALMRPKAPKAGKRIFLERIKSIWSRMNFTQKITARNLFRYKKRFLMTVLGIGGCTALLLSGFGLKDSILSIAAIQFDELYQYDMLVQLKKDIAIDDRTEFINMIDKEKRISDYMLTREQSVDIGVGNIEKTVSMIVPENVKKFEEFVIFRVRGTNEKVDFPGDGIIINEKLARMLEVGAGDSIYIKNDDGQKMDVKISGITEHYISHYIYMSPSLYEKVFGKNIRFQQIMAKTIDTSEIFESKLSTDLLKNKDISSIRFTTGISSDFKSIIKSLNYVILVLIFSAGALAFIVLYNLTNVNVTERLREIATIKVLGFFDREVSAYVDRESTILTIIGMLAGLVMGIFLHRYIIVTAEVEYVMFGRNVKFGSFIYSALLTLFFSVMVNIVMHFRLKKINMVESLKSVD